MALVTREQVMLALRIEDADDAANVDLKIKQAEDIVLDFIQPKPDPAWTAETAPGRVTAAVILVVGYLYSNSDEAQEALAALSGGTAIKASPVAALLWRLRTPTLA